MRMPAVLAEAVQASRTTAVRSLERSSMHYSPPFLIQLNQVWGIRNSLEYGAQKREPWGLVIGVLLTHSHPKNSMNATREQYCPWQRPLSALPLTPGPRLRRSSPHSQQIILIKFALTSTQISYLLTAWFYRSAEHSYFLLKSTEIALFQHILRSDH